MNTKDSSYSGIMSFDVAVTRVINPCALIEVGDHVVLTDPYFTNHRLFPMNEPIGLSPGQLPRSRRDPRRPRRVRSLAAAVIGRLRAPIDDAGARGDGADGAHGEASGLSRRPSPRMGRSARARSGPRGHGRAGRAHQRDAHQQLCPRRTRREGVRRDRGAQPRSDRGVRSGPRRRRSRSSPSTDSSSSVAAW